VNTRRLARLCLLASLGAGCALADGTITLRPVVRVAGDTPLVLSTIATLEGPEAVALAGLAIERRGESVTIEDIREAIGADPSVHWGRLTLAGSRCRVVRIEPVGPAQALDAPIAAPEPDAAASEPDVRSLVLPRIAASLGTPIDRLHVELDRAGPDSAILSEPIAGRTIDIRPIGMSDRLPISITVYEQNRLVARGVVRAQVTTLREVAAARVPIQRGEALTQDNIERQSVWLGLTARALTLEECLGRVARGRIGAGEHVSGQDAAPPIAIRKGDQAMIHCISGSVILKLRARAMADGAPGDTIEFTGLDGKKGRVILARVESPGIAIATTDDGVTSQ
jgi:flagella basal body P-ring formation protein FlgA